jgi:TPR repeat protein
MSGPNTKQSNGFNKNMFIFPMDQNNRLMDALRLLYIERDETLLREIVKTEQHNTSSSFCLARLLSDQGKDIEAFQFFMQAAEHKHELAILEVAKRLEDGIGVVENAQLAMINYKKIPQHPVAQLRLGFCYEEGRGCHPDQELALEWFEKAALQGNDIAQLKMGLATNDNEWFLKSAKQGNRFAQNSLGHILRTSNGFSGEYLGSAEWFELAARQGCANSQYELALCYESGTGGVAQSENLAFEWFLCAARQNHAAAENNVGCIISYPKSEYWFLRSAQHGNRAGQYNYGHCCQESQDFEQAVFWFRKSAEQECACAQYALGVCYAESRGVQQSWDRALHFWRLSAAQDFEPAKLALATHSPTAPTLEIKIS